MMRPWNFLVKIKIQGQEFEGTITAHSSDEKTAKKLAQITYINALRRVGVWTSVEDGVNRIDEDTTETIKIYRAPTFEDIEILEQIELSCMDLTFPAEEGLKETPSITKRKTSGEAALDKRTKKIKKNDSKAITLQSIVGQFEEPKTLKQVAKDLGIVYQVVRYRIQKIVKEGIGDDRYEMIESQIGGMKTIQLKKKKIL